MKRVTFVLMTLLLFLVPTCIFADPGSAATKVLIKYFDARGGLAKLQQIKNLSVKVDLEIYEYKYEIHMLGTGQFRQEQQDQIIIFDGKKYWQSFHGLVNEISQQQREQYQNTGIQKIFSHGLIDEQGTMVTANFLKKEKKHGHTYNILSLTTPEGYARTLYFNDETGLLDKIIDEVDDPQFRKKKIVRKYGSYVHVDGLKFFGKSEAHCITTGEMEEYPLVYSDFQINQTISADKFSKPVATAPQVVLEDGALKAQIIGFSLRGSYITSVTPADIGKLDLKDGMKLQVKIKDQSISMPYFNALSREMSIGQGDYIATFNNTPALWIVKAYIGMVTDHKAEKGDEIIISKVMESENVQTDAEQQSEDETSKVKPDEEENKDEE